MSTYFAPDSIAWKIHADPSLVVGGIRALLEQGLHPGAMAGVAAHSNFREDSWGRLTRKITVAAKSRRIWSVITFTLWTR